ncbi:MAG TPA: ThiF family adenylyltransferase [Xanthomonadales bacterium]|nr:ThiF family adenylyltransferase [Xanthomonadales bacterium]
MNPIINRQPLDRYHRQMLLAGFGAEGQQKLLDSTALVLGCGALGTVSANMLARAGVGHLVIVDRDFIDLTNLQRQVLFDEADIAAGLPKAEAAKRKIAQINSQVRVTAVVDDINHRNIARLAENADILVDGLDNFETRYLANDCAVKFGKPYVYGGAVGTTGMACSILPHSKDSSLPWESLPDGSHATPCFRCLFEQPPAGESPTCDTVGVLGPAVSIIANFQAAEALKILTGNYAQVNKKLLNIDLWTNVLMQLDLSSSWEETDCPTCKHRQFDYLDGKAGSSATSLCGRDAVQLLPPAGAAGINLQSLAQRLQQHGETSNNEFMLRAKVQESGKAFELSVFANGRAIIKGTGDITEARSVYAKYIGI